MTELFPYQHTGAAWLAERKHALLADPMGLGKTAQAIRGCDLVGARTILVLCPASVRENWRREFLKFSEVAREIKIVRATLTTITPGAVNIISYDGAASGKIHAAILSANFDVAIFDEAHFLKSPTAKRTQAVFGFKKVPGIVSKCARVWLLSGTPAPNNPFELYPMCRVLFSDGFKDENGKVMNKWDFIGRFCSTVDNGFGLKITGGKNLEELKTRLQPYFLRRAKQSRPPVVDNLYLDAGQLKLPPDAEAIVAKLLENNDDPLEALRALERSKTHIATLRRMIGMAKVEPLTAWIRDQIESGLEKIVVFAYHRDVLDAYEKNLGEELQIVRIDGSTFATERDSRVQRFKNEPKCKMFLGQHQAAGTGVDGLQVASTLVLAEYSWVPSENDQIIGRIDRHGQLGNPMAFYAVASNTLDERIASAARHKRTTISKVFA